MINLHKNTGFALTFSLIFLFLIVAFVSVYFTTISNGLVIANRTANETKAYYIAEAGIVDAYERIIQSPQTTTPPQTTVSYIPTSTTDNGVYSVNTNSGNYTVSITLSYSPRINYTITSTGTYNKTSKTLQLKMIGAAVSKYAYWSQTETSPIYGNLWWISGMVTTGPVQTNGTLNIWGNPIFNGSVSEAGSSPDYYNSSSTPSKIWGGGLTNNADVVNLPPQGILNAIDTVATNGGLVLTGASTITFNSTGTITVTGKNVNGGTTTTYSKKTMSAPANGTIYVQSTVVNGVSKNDGNVTIQGTVSGELTVAADQNVYVSGSLSYNSDPRDNASSTDLLGVVANQNIIITEATAPTSLEMSGVLVALQGSFEVDQWSTYRGNATTAVMDQYGSLVNNYCGPTGEFDPSSGALLGGWNQIQAYDSRLATIAPPGFPPYVNNKGYGVYTKLGFKECFAGVCS
jgi:Tfp pilus assembly protein PilX